MLIKGGVLVYIRVGLCLLRYVLGTILRIPSSGNLEAASQRFPPEAFQRLFRRRGVVPCDLRLPKTDLGGGECVVFMGCGYQDEHLAGWTCNWLDPAACIADETSAECFISYGSSTGKVHSFKIWVDVPNQICCV